MRKKCLFNIKESTKLKIEDLAVAEDLPESYMLDNIVENYYRIYMKLERKKLSEAIMKRWEREENDINNNKN